MSVRLGAVSYLNTRPLTAALARQQDAFALNFSVPAVCAADLRAGRVDLGLIPSIEYARSSEPYWIVPGVAIAARGEVLTVRLFHRLALEKVRRVALDTSSRTSAALLRVLLRERFHLEPELVEAPPDLESMLGLADAALLIGDPVFRYLDGCYESVDLGAEWALLTGLPFVFAFWAGREGAVDPERVRALVEARRQGAGLVPEIARQFARERGGEAALYERYLRENIHFDLGPAEEQGLLSFYEKARRHGLIEQVPPLRFYSCGGRR